MPWWNSPPMWGMWWIFPLMGLVFIIVVLFAISQFLGGRGAFRGGQRYDELEDLRREVRELKEEIAKLRKKE